MPACRTKLIGIQIVYCVDGGEPKRVWVNLKQVHALAWCREEVAPKPARKGGSSKLPTDPNGPGKCPQPQPKSNPHGMSDGGDEPICWWNGTAWVCGDEDN